MHLVERVFQLELPFKKTARLFSIVWATEEKAALIFSFLFDFPYASIQSGRVRISVLATRVCHPTARTYMGSRGRNKEKTAFQSSVY
jgi:hypothetical protein